MIPGDSSLDLGSDFITGVHLGVKTYSYRFFFFAMGEMNFHFILVRYVYGLSWNQKQIHAPILAYIYIYIYTYISYIYLYVVNIYIICISHTHTAHIQNVYVPLWVVPQVSLMQFFYIVNTCQHVLSQIFSMYSIPCLRQVKNNENIYTSCTYGTYDT